MLVQIDAVEKQLGGKAPLNKGNEEADETRSEQTDPVAEKLSGQPSEQSDEGGRSDATSIGSEASDVPKSDIPQESVPNDDTATNEQEPVNDEFTPPDLGEEWSTLIQAYESPHSVLYLGVINFYRGRLELDSDWTQQPTPLLTFLKAHVTEGCPTGLMSLIVESACLALRASGGETPAGEQSNMRKIENDTFDALKMLHSQGAPFTGTGDGPQGSLLRTVVQQGYQPFIRFVLHHALPLTATDTSQVDLQTALTDLRDVIDETRLRVEDLVECVLQSEKTWISELGISDDDYTILDQDARNDLQHTFLQSQPQLLPMYHELHMARYVLDELTQHAARILAAEGVREQNKRTRSLMESSPYRVAPSFLQTLTGASEDHGSAVRDPLGSGFLCLGDGNVGDAGQLMLERMLEFWFPNSSGYLRQLDDTLAVAETLEPLIFSDCLSPAAGESRDFRDVLRDLEELDVLSAPSSEVSKASGSHDCEGRGSDAEPVYPSRVEMMDES